MDPYNTLERPVLNESDPLQLSFGLTLMQIIDVVSINGMLQFILSLYKNNNRYFVQKNVIIYIKGPPCQNFAAR